MEPIASVGTVLEMFDRYVQVKKDANEEIPSEVEKAYMNHLTWRFKNLRWSCRLYVWTAVVLSLAVIAMFGMGLRLADLQLTHAIASGSTAELATEVSIAQSTEARITSSVVGVTVLFLSLFFFYLYLKHVFTEMRFIPAHLSLKDTDYSLLDPETTERVRRSGKTAKEIINEVLEGKKD